MNDTNAQAEVPERMKAKLEELLKKLSSNPTRNPFKDDPRFVHGYALLEPKSKRTLRVYHDPKAAALDALKSNLICSRIGLLKTTGGYVKVGLQCFRGQDLVGF